MGDARCDRCHCGDRCTDSARPADRQDLPRDSVMSPVHCRAASPTLGANQRAVRTSVARHSCGTKGPYRCFRVLSVTSGHRRATRSTSAGPQRVGRSTEYARRAWIRSSMSSQIAADLDVTGSDQAIVIGVAVDCRCRAGHRLRAACRRARRRQGHPEDAGDLRSRPGGRGRLPRPAVPHAGVFVVDRLRAALRAAGDDHERAHRPIDLLPVRRAVLGDHRLLRHVAGDQGERPGGRRRQRRRRPGEGHADRLPHRRRRRSGHHRPRPARRLRRRPGLRRRTRRRCWRASVSAPRCWPCS